MNQVVGMKSSSVLTAGGTSVEDYENLVRRFIKERLREDQKWLRAFQVTPFVARTIEEAMFIEQHPRGLLRIEGFIAPPGSDNGRAFGLTIEMKLSDQEDADIARKVAESCFRCVKQMKKDLRRGKPLHSSKTVH